MSKLAVRGDVRAATPEGFAKLIQRANEVAGDGYRLVGVVNVGTKSLGAIYVHMPERPESNLVGD